LSRTLSTREIWHTLHLESHGVTGQQVFSTQATDHQANECSGPLNWTAPTGEKAVPQGCGEDLLLGDNLLRIGSDGNGEDDHEHGDDD
jgi:hypothetical protein